MGTVGGGGRGFGGFLSSLGSSDFAVLRGKWDRERGWARVCELHVD